MLHPPTSATGTLATSRDHVYRGTIALTGQLCRCKSNARSGKFREACWGGGAGRGRWIVTAGVSESRMGHAGGYEGPGDAAAAQTAAA